jgi:hypothetical protein
MAKKPYGGYGSYQLTDEQVRQAIKAFEWDFLEDTDDEKTGIFLALLRSFAFTDDNTRREEMLLAAESVMMPVTNACENALTQLAIKAHQTIIKEGGTQ